MALHKDCFVGVDTYLLIKKAKNDAMQKGYCSIGGRLRIPEEKISAHARAHYTVHICSCGYMSHEAGDAEKHKEDSETDQTMRHFQLETDEKNYGKCLRTLNLIQNPAVPKTWKIFQHLLEEGEVRTPEPRSTQQKPKLLITPGPPARRVTPPSPKRRKDSEPASTPMTSPSPTGLAATTALANYKKTLDYQAKTIRHSIHELLTAADEMRKHPLLEARCDRVNDITVQLLMAHNELRKIAGEILSLE